MFSGGIWSTTVTPFDEDGNIDETSLRSLIDYYISSGVHGLSLGVLGEVSKLTETEKDDLIKILVHQTNERVPVSIVCTAQGTKVASSFASKAEKLGAQAVMISPPNHLVEDEAIFKHYREVSYNISIPIIVQDNPASTGSKISSSLLAKMANDIENIQFVKLEDSPTTIKTSDVLEKTDELKILSGGAMFLYEELERGMVGTMSGLPFPEVLVQIYNLFLDGKKNAARKLFNQYLPLMRYDEILPPNVETRAIIKKEVFKQKGIIKSSNVRTPSYSIDYRTIEELKDILEYIDLNN